MIQIQQPFVYNEHEVMYYDLLEGMFVEADVKYERPYADSGIWVEDDIYNEFRNRMKLILAIVLTRDQAVAKLYKQKKFVKLPNSHGG